MDRIRQPIGGHCPPYQLMDCIRKGIARRVLELYEEPTRGNGKMNATERAVLERFKAELTERLDVVEIILFGSRARGDADLFSDMDVIVILQGEADDASCDIVSDCAWEAGFEPGIVVAPIVFSRVEWLTGAIRSSLLGKAVEQEGLVV